MSSDTVFADCVLIDQRGRTSQGNTAPMLRAVSPYGRVAVCVTYIYSSLSLDSQQVFLTGRQVVISDKYKGQFHESTNMKSPQVERPSLMAIRDPECLDVMIEIKLIRRCQCTNIL